MNCAALRRSLLMTPQRFVTDGCGLLYFQRVCVLLDSRPLWFPRTAREEVLFLSCSYLYAEDVSWMFSVSVY
jgi:hypothetical protein